MAQKQCFVGKKRRFRRKNSKPLSVMGGGGTPLFRYLFPVNFLGGCLPWWGGGYPPFPWFFSLNFLAGRFPWWGEGGYPHHGHFPWLGFLNTSLGFDQSVFCIFLLYFYYFCVLQTKLSVLCQVRRKSVQSIHTDLSFRILRLVFNEKPLLNLIVMFKDKIFNAICFIEQWEMRTDRRVLWNKNIQIYLFLLEEPPLITRYVWPGRL